MVYQSKQNPLIKKIYSLKDKKGRREHGLYIVEGLKMVTEAIKSNQEIDLIVVKEGVEFSFNKDIELITVSAPVFDYLSDEKSPQGVLAVLKMPNLELKSPKANAILLDGVSDPGNLGTIIRTACASGYQDLYLVNCVDPYSNKTVRSSMSGIYFVNLYRCDYDSAFKVLSNHELIVGDLDGEDLFGYKPKKPYCIAVGNEANGISDAVKDKATKILTIPMSENSESLNVAVATSIMMYNLKNSKEN